MKLTLFIIALSISTQLLADSLELFGLKEVESVPTTAPEIVAQTSHFSITYSGFFTSKDSSAKSRGTYGKNNYRNFMNALAAQGNTNALNILTLEDLESDYLATNKAQSYWSTLSGPERSGLLHIYAQQIINQNIPLGLILSEYSIRSMILNPSQWKNYLHEIKDKLSFEEKIRLASHFGGKFGDNYNYDRADQVGSEGEGIVTIEEMLQSVSSNEPGGICRDVTLAQSQILKELGVAHSSIYMVSYKTTNGRHAILAALDPENPGNIVKLNYSYITENSEVHGNAQLTQDTTIPDIGILYKVYDANGTPVAQVPTEVGQIFKDVTNQDRHHFSKNYMLQKAQIQTYFGQATLFKGETSAADKVSGVALNGSMKGRSWESDYSAAIANRKGNRTLVTIDQISVYAHLNFRLNSPDMNIGNNFKVKAFSGIQSENQLATTRLRRKSNSTILADDYGIDPSTVVYAGVRADWKTKKGRASSEFKASTYHDWNNVVNTSEGQGLHPEQVTWTTQHSENLSESTEVTGSLSVQGSQLGGSATINTQFRNTENGLSAQASYQMSLGRPPSFTEDFNEMISFEISKDERDEHKLGPIYSIQYQKNLANDDEVLGIDFGWDH